MGDIGRTRRGDWDFFVSYAAGDEK